MTEKKLYRSKKDRVFFGVCGGLAEYFEIDPVIVRLLTVIISIWGGIGVVAYILGALIIPEGENEVETKKSSKKGQEDFGKKMETAAQQIKESVEQKSGGDKRWIGGLVLITLGLLFLIQQFVPFLDFGKTWPLFLIILGVIVIFGGRQD